MDAATEYTIANRSSRLLSTSILRSASQEWKNPQRCRVRSQSKGSRCACGNIRACVKAREAVTIRKAARAINVEMDRVLNVFAATTMVVFHRAFTRSQRRRCTRIRFSSTRDASSMHRIRALEAPCSLRLFGMTKEEVPPTIHPALIRETARATIRATTARDSCSSSSRSTGTRKILGSASRTTRLPARCPNSSATQKHQVNRLFSLYPCTTAAAAKPVPPATATLRQHLLAVSHTGQVRPTVVVPCSQTVGRTVERAMETRLRRARFPPTPITSTDAWCMSAVLRAKAGLPVLQLTRRSCRMSVASSTGIRGLHLRFRHHRSDHRGMLSAAGATARHLRHTNTDTNRSRRLTRHCAPWRSARPLPHRTPVPGITTGQRYRRSTHYRSKAAQAVLERPGLTLRPTRPPRLV